MPEPTPDPHLELIRAAAETLASAQFNPRIDPDELAQWASKIVNLVSPHVPADRLPFLLATVDEYLATICGRPVPLCTDQ